MTIQQELDLRYEYGLEDGIEKGIEQGLVSLVKDGIISASVAAKRLNISEDQLAELLK